MTFLSSIFALLTSSFTFRERRSQILSYNINICPWKSLLLTPHRKMKVRRMRTEWIRFHALFRIHRLFTSIFQWMCFSSPLFDSILMLFENNEWAFISLQPLPATPHAQAHYNYNFDYSNSVSLLDTYFYLRSFWFCSKFEFALCSPLLENSFGWWASRRSEMITENHICESTRIYKRISLLRIGGEN